MIDMKKLLKVLLAVCLVFVLSVSIIVDCAEAATEKSKVRLNKTDVTLFVGQALDLDVYGTSKKVIWSSSNNKVVSVNKDGIIEAVGEGQAVITAKVGDKTLKCKVNVKNVTCKTVFSNGSMLMSINTLQFSTKEVRKYSDGSYEVDAYIYNGFNRPVSNIKVTKMSLYDRNGNLVASAAFGPCTNLVLLGQTYAVWTFRFNSDCTNNGDFDFSTICLRVYWECS